MFDIEGKFVWAHCSGWEYMDDRRSKLVEDLSLQGKLDSFSGKKWTSKYLQSGAGNEESWRSLLTDQYEADIQTLQQMKQKIDLEKFQIEHPGLDFSGATLDKKYWFLK